MYTGDDNVQIPDTSERIYTMLCALPHKECGFRYYLPVSGQVSDTLEVEFSDNLEGYWSSTLGMSLEMGLTGKRVSFVIASGRQENQDTSGWCHSKMLWRKQHPTEHCSLCALIFRLISTLLLDATGDVVANSADLGVWSKEPRFSQLVLSLSRPARALSVPGMEVCR